MLPVILACPPVFIRSSELQDGHKTVFVLYVYKTLTFLHDSHSTFTKLLRGFGIIILCFFISNHFKSILLCLDFQFSDTHSLFHGLSLACLASIPQSNLFGGFSGSFLILGTFDHRILFYPQRGVWHPEPPFGLCPSYK